MLHPEGFHAPQEFVCSQHIARTVRAWPSKLISLVIVEIELTKKRVKQLKSKLSLRSRIRRLLMNNPATMEEISLILRMQHRRVTIQLVSLLRDGHITCKQQFPRKYGQGRLMLNLYELTEIGRKHEMDD